MSERLILERDCTFVHLVDCPPPSDCVYTCKKEAKIDTFFHQDFPEYEREQLGTTYGYYLGEERKQLVAAFTIANSALILDFLQSARKNKVNKEIPRVKQRRQYPALLICQLAVFDEFKGMDLGDQVLDHISQLGLILGRQCACRFLLVEAVNKPKVIDFYSRNGFVMMYSSEDVEIEKMKRKVDEDGHLATRLMMMDLASISD